MYAVWPRPESEELLSSYLCRAAVARGQSSHSFMALVSPGSPVWTRDVDSCCGSQLLLDISAASGLRPETVADMTLCAWIKRTARGGQKNGIYHWISSVGVYHRLRRRCGLAYCPHCLAERGCFLKQWRLSFWTVCPTHQARMCDCCPRCHVSIHPHYQTLDVTRCWSCNFALTNAPARDDRPLPVQGLLLSALLDTHSSFSACGHEFGGSDLLWGADALLSGFRTSRAPDSAVAGERWARLELRRCDARHADMALLGQILSLSPAKLRERAELDHVTQKCFRAAGPPWVDELVACLPYGRKARAGVPLPTDARLVADAQRRRLDGWRSKRARLLLKLIGNKNEY